MGGFIFYIIVIVAIVKISKKSQKNNMASQNQGAGTTISSAQPRTNSVPMENTVRSNNTATASGQSQKRTTSKVSTTGAGSTTEMLRRKAEEDQANHDKEKKYAEYKQKKTHMGKKYAQRYLIGDPVPPNMKIKCCGYCGAENLLTHGNREQLLCYFCREELK